eukprot:GHRR01020809.1.p1 GENE.GHRR01020809.1~~GHRR01020809.1.p1  ORF type:complete len:676 (+),score=194.88 GHRR01020809.1:118-2145(+)
MWLRYVQIMAVMFVWVMVGGVIEAAQHLEDTGAQLLGGIASRAKVQQPSDTSATDHNSSLVIDREQGRHLVMDKQHHRQHRQQQWLLHTPVAALNNGLKGLWPVVELVLLLPVLNNAAALAHTAGTAAAQAMTAAVSACCNRKPALRLAAVERSNSSRKQWLAFRDRLRTDVALAAAVKLWLAMSGLLALTLIVAASWKVSTAVSAVVSAAVSAFPVPGIIAFVLAWHERVESTIVRVLMRIAGTAAGTAIAHGLLSQHVIATSPVLLILMMSAIAMVLAPLAAPSYHLRLTTALILISCVVTVACQYDPGIGAAQGTPLYLATRITEVTIACLWAAVFNYLLMPWSTARWCVQNMAKCYVQVAALMQDACQLQFSAYQQLQDTLSQASSLPGNNSPRTTSSCSNGASQQVSVMVLKLDKQVAVQRAALQGKVITPLVAVQNALHLETNLWGSHGIPALVVKQVKRFLRAMLELSDSLTALQVTIAALPELQLTPTDHHVDGQLIAEGQHAKGDNAVVEFEQSESHAVYDSLLYLNETFMQPLHEAHAVLLATVQETAVAVQQHLVQSKGGVAVLSSLHDKLHNCWHSSTALFASRRHTIHHHIRLRHLDSLNPRTDQGSQRNDKVVQSNDPSGHMWWLYAGRHYQQQLAYQHAFDATIVQLLKTLSVLAKPARH